MDNPLKEYQEWNQMRDNIRRCVDALELCWLCQRVCECGQEVVDDGPPVWLCDHCLHQMRTRQNVEREALAGAFRH